MARKSKKPAAVKVGKVHARCVRGPHKDGSGRWYWQALVFSGEGGGQRTVWSGWATPDACLRRVAELVAECGAEPDAPSPAEATAEVQTVRDLLECWVASQQARADLTRFAKRSYRSCATHVAAGLGAVRLDRVSPTALEGYRDRRCHAGAATATVHRELKVLRAAWQWGREIGACPDRDLPRVKLTVRPKREKRTPSPGEVGAVLEQLDGWPRLAVFLLYSTGARIREVASLTWADVDLRTGTLALTGKGSTRHVPVLPEVVAELRAWGPGEPDASVLGVTTNLVCSHLSSRHLSAACEAAKVPRFTPHGLRRAAEDRLARAGVDVATYAAILGHSPQVALQHYRRATPADCRAAVKAAGLGAVPGGTVLAFPGATGTDDA